MGWTGCEGIFKDARDFFRHEFASEIGDGQFVDFSFGKREKSEWGDGFETWETPVFCAMKGENGNVSGMVILLDERRESGRTEWLYKMIGENAGPVEDRCPEKILGLLDAPESENARAWREKCWRNLGKEMPEEERRGPAL